MGVVVVVVQQGAVAVLQFAVAPGAVSGSTLRFVGGGGWKVHVVVGWCGQVWAGGQVAKPGGPARVGQISRRGERARGRSTNELGF